MPSDLLSVYMVPRNSIQLLSINTTKFPVECSQSNKSESLIIFNILIQNNKYISLDWSNVATVWHFAILQLSWNGRIPCELIANLNLASFSSGAPRDDANYFSKKNKSSLLKMSFNIEYSCHTITNIICVLLAHWLS